MPTVKFVPSNITLDKPAGTSILEVARAANIEIDSACGGIGKCGKCVVKIISGDVDFENRGILKQDLVDTGYVLACKTKLKESSLIVEIPNLEECSCGKFKDQDDETSRTQQDLLPPNWNYNGLTQKFEIIVPPPKLEDGLSDLDRLTRSIQEKIGKKDIQYPLSVIRKVPDVLREKVGKLFVILFPEPNYFRMIDLSSTDIQEFGIAVDVGTTSMAVQLISLPSGQIIATYCDYNEQIYCGPDIISRINYAGRKNGLSDLRLRAIKTINQLIGSILKKHNVDSINVSATVISGNTTMIHLLLGIQPEYIRLEPYTPAVLDVPRYTAQEVGIKINPNGIVYCSPAVGSYVGGDITAGLLCTDLDLQKETSLFIDIGTNSELVIGNKEFLMTCACSAGPAFEGGGLEFGMRAIRGAIDKVTIDPITGKINYHVVGDIKPKGICGTGVISLLTQLFLTGWIDPAGKINRTRKSPYIEITGRVARYILEAAEKTFIGRVISISEPEINNILRAKAAIYSAISLILKQIDMNIENLSALYIGGSFGRYLDLESAIILGLLPDLPIKRFRYLGNTSLIGSYLVLLSQEYRQRQLDIAKRMTYLELNTDQSYMDQYTAALFIPHTNIELFPTVKQIIEKKSSSK